jgi:integral membrane protein
MPNNTSTTRIQHKPMTPGRLFRFFALSEGITWALLLSGLAARATVGAPPILVTIVGGIHGAVFLGYGVTAALIGVNNRWGFGRTVLGIVLAIIPFATVPFESVVSKRGLLSGEWRRTATADPRDAHWFDRLFRWFLNRPVLLGLTLLIVIVAIFATLLSLGPPDGWVENAG